MGHVIITSGSCACHWRECIRVTQEMRDLVVAYAAFAAYKL